MTTDCNSIWMESTKGYSIIYFRFAYIIFDCIEFPFRLSSRIVHASDCNDIQYRYSILNLIRFHRLHNSWIHRPTFKLRNGAYQLGRKFDSMREESSPSQEKRKTKLWTERKTTKNHFHTFTLYIQSNFLSLLLFIVFHFMQSDK